MDSHEDHEDDAMVGAAGGASAGAGAGASSGGSGGGSSDDTLVTVVGYTISRAMKEIIDDAIKRLPAPTAEDSTVIRSSDQKYWDGLSKNNTDGPVMPHHMWRRMLPFV